MNDMETAWRVEEACLNARPSAVETHFDGWLIRSSGGPVRRTNSVNPSRFCSADFPAVIDAAEAIYRRLDRHSLFKVPTIANRIDSHLDRLGYVAEGESLVLMAELDGTGFAKSDVDIATGSPSEDWIRAWEAVNVEVSQTESSMLHAATSSIVLPKVFAAKHVNGSPVSIAYCVVHRGLAVIESVATHPDHRGRGHAADVLSTVLSWARANGAGSGCLAVLADNIPALALYASLGFKRELFRYHYRRRI